MCMTACSERSSPVIPSPTPQVSVTPASTTAEPRPLEPPTPGLTVGADPRTPEPGALLSDCARADRCMAGYDAFLERASTHARPVERDTLWAQLWHIVDTDAPPATEAPSGLDLPGVLARDGNVSWLLAEAERGRASVTECGSTLWGPAKQIRLCVDDPWVGRFEALLLLPGLDGPYPAVVAHPGHAETPEYHRDYRHARSLIEAGYVVAILDPRAFAGDEYEHEIAERLLLQGHVLVSLRLYELTVVRRYLASRADVDGGRIGLMGHSGGSDPANLGAFVDRGWGAVVIDSEGWFMARIDQNKQLSSEASPDLWPWHKLMQTTESPVPRLVQEYAYPDGPGPVVRFLDGQLARPAGERRK